MGTLLQVLFLAVGFVMLVKGADWFVEGAKKNMEEVAEEARHDAGMLWGIFRVSLDVVILYVLF